MSSRDRSFSTPRPGGRERDAFTCVHCRQTVAIYAYGTKHRNHCPLCLWSRHVDDAIGDRQSPCRAPMEPIAVEAKRDGEWAIVHRCTAPGCAALRTNRIAGDDRELALLQLALRPLANPPFPLDHLAPLSR